MCPSPSASLDLRIFGAVGADVIIVASDASRGPARVRIPYARGGAPGRGTAGEAGAATSALFGPSLTARHYLSLSSLTLATGRKRTNVATYGLFCVGCHTHVLIEG